MLLKLCASFHSHQWIQTGAAYRKRPIWSQLAIFVPYDIEMWRMSLEKEHLFYATSSPAHHFVANDEFKLDL